MAKSLSPERQQLQLDGDFRTACANGLLDQAQDLLERGARWEAHGKINQETALMQAAKNAQVEIVDWLLHRVPEEQARKACAFLNKYDETPLHETVFSLHAQTPHRSAECARLLLPFSFINARSSLLETPLERALSHGSLELVDVLLPAAMNAPEPSEPTRLLCRALRLPRDKGHPMALRLLHDHALFLPPAAPQTTLLDPPRDATAYDSDTRVSCALQALSETGEGWGLSFFKEDFLVWLSTLTPEPFFDGIASNNPVQPPAPVLDAPSSLVQSTRAPFSSSHSSHTREAPSLRAQGFLRSFIRDSLKWPPGFGSVDAIATRFVLSLLEPASLKDAGWFDAVEHAAVRRRDLLDALFDSDVVDQHPRASAVRARQWETLTRLQPPVPLQTLCPRTHARFESAQLRDSLSPFASEPLSPRPLREPPILGPRKRL